MKQKYYRCEECGKVISADALSKRVTAGDLPYCYCEWTPDNRVYNPYKEVEDTMIIKLCDGFYTIEFTPDFDVVIIPKEGESINLTESDLTIIYGAFKQMQSSETDVFSENDIILESGVAIFFHEESLIELYIDEDASQPDVSLDPGEFTMIYGMNRQRILNQIEEDAVSDGSRMI